MPALHYQPDYETPEKDEAEVAQQLTDTMVGISRKVHEHGHAPSRSVHAKSHGIVMGELQVLAGLPPELAQGLFAKPSRYPAIMRFSTTPGDFLPDSVSTPRGLAIKIIGTEGARLPGSESDVTQDFVMVNGPAFQVPNAKAFLASLKLLAATTDKIEGVKTAMSAAMRGVEKVIEGVGLSSATVRSMGGEPPHHPLGESYFTQVPFLYGDYMAKLCVVPVAADLLAVKNQKLDITEDPLTLRKAVKEYFTQHGGTWEIRVQLCTDLEAMPIEKADKVWPEDASPYVSVARLSVPAQDAWNEARTPSINDGLSFSPWHGLAAHRPLGSVMRVRKLAYEKSVAFRAQASGRQIREPQSMQDVEVLAAPAAARATA